MYKIKSLKKLLPFKYNNFELRLINKEDIYWYINNFQSDYFNEFIDDDTVFKLPYEEIEYKLINLVLSYKMSISMSGEARLVYENRDTGEIVAGITIFEVGNNKVELGYWVIPSYQGKGIGKQIINNTLEVLQKMYLGYKVILEIREDNIASVKLAEGLGFKHIKNKSGKIKTNKIYELEVKNIE